jgi:hypothetical protein
MNYSHRIIALTDQVEALAAHACAQRCLLRVLIMRAAQASPTWQVTLADVREASSYDLMAAPISGIPANRQPAVREAAQREVDENIRDLRELYAECEHRGFPMPGSE